jgi:hypothetical protein
MILHKLDPVTGVSSAIVDISGTNDSIYFVRFAEAQTDNSQQVFNVTNRNQREPFVQIVEVGSLGMHVFNDQSH